LSRLFLISLSVDKLWISVELTIDFTLGKIAENHISPVNSFSNHENPAEYSALWAGSFT